MPWFISTIDMRILLFDPFSGAAGDMIIGSLLDCGADEDLVSKAMASVAGKPTIHRVDRCGISAIKVETHAEEEHRTLKEVLSIVETGKAPDESLEMAKRVFLRIHRAEQSVHGKSSHFHEVGADDAIADVIGACTALHSLKTDGVAVLPVHLGRGFARSAHGRFPIPAPATMAILCESGLGISQGNEKRELCTPTGAALLSEFSTIRPADVAVASIEKNGYGAGSRNPDDTPNVLRVSLLNSEAVPAPAGDCVDILETNVDDVTGEVIAYTLQKLMNSGARDACAIPIIMKKGRSGELIRVISHPEKTQALVEIMSAELGTLGIRCISSVHRSLITRTIMDINIKFGDRNYTISAKTGWLNGIPSSVKAEYEEARACAEQEGIPLRLVTRKVEEKAWQEIEQRSV